MVMMLLSSPAAAAAVVVVKCRFLPVQKQKQQVVVCVVRFELFEHSGKWKKCTIFTNH